MTLDEDMAAGFARLTLGHVGQQWPNKLDHVMTGPDDVALPAALHPVFHGSFDWHSCVHGWWQLLTIARLFPTLPEADEIRALADAMLVPDKVAGEVAYLERPGTGGFERPYGWAWALALHGEAGRHDAGWAEALEPLARAFALRWRGYLPRLTYPVRSGTHGNIAFASVLALDWAAVHDPRLARELREAVRGWFGEDRGCQAWEPGGDEFLSPALCEALAMSRVLPRPAFGEWFARFLPRVARGEPVTLFTPATVSDRTDGKIAHLDGLNLSRTWCWRALARELGPGHAAHGRMTTAADAHLAASLPHLADDYAGTHWLATFALLALLA